MNERAMFQHIKNLKKHIFGNVLMRALSLLSYCLMIYGFAVLLEAIQLGRLNIYIEILVILVALGALGSRWFTNRFANRFAYAAEKDICDQLQDQIFEKIDDCDQSRAAAALDAISDFKKIVSKDLSDQYYNRVSVILLTFFLALSDWRAALILFAGAVLLEGKIALEKKNQKSGSDTLDQLIAAFFYIASAAVTLSHYAKGMPLASALVIILLGFRLPLPHKKSNHSFTAMNQMDGFLNGFELKTDDSGQENADLETNDINDDVTFKDLDLSLESEKKDIERAQTIKMLEIAFDCLTKMSFCMTLLESMRETWFFLACMFMILKILFDFWSEKQHDSIHEKMKDEKDSIQAYAAVYKPQKTGFTSAGALMAAVLFQRNFMIGLLTVACVIVIGIVIPFMSMEKQAAQRRSYENDQRIVNQMILSKDSSYEEKRARIEEEGLDTVNSEDAITANVQALADLFLIMEVFASVMLYANGNMNFVDILITLGISISLFEKGIKTTILKETAYQALYDFSRKSTANNG